MQRFRSYVEEFDQVPLIVVPPHVAEEMMAPRYGAKTFVATKATTKNLRRMCVCARSLWKSKGRIPFVHGSSPKKGGDAPTAGPKRF